MKLPQPIGKYVLSFQPLQLREGRRVVDLTPRQLRVLEELVRARGEVVPKQTFFEQIWSGLAVEDGNLTQTIFLLRRALGTLASGQEYIETVPREGYRLTREALEAASDLEGRSSASMVAGQARPEEQLRALVNSIEEYGIYMLDCAGRVVTWNAGAEKITGYARQEILGQHYSTFFVGEDLEARSPRRQMATAAKCGRFAGEGWSLRKSGERIWASFDLSAIRNQGGPLLGYAAVVRDLTERRRTEEALRRSEAGLRRERDFLRAAADSSMDAFWVCEPVRGVEGEIEDFVVTYLNDGAQRMFSISHEAVLGVRMCDLLPACVSEHLLEPYRRVLLDGERFLADVALPDGRLGGKWVRIQAVRTSDGVAVTLCILSERRRFYRQMAERSEGSQRSEGPEGSRGLEASKRPDGFDPVRHRPSTDAG